MARKQHIIALTPKTYAVHRSIRKLDWRGSQGSSGKLENFDGSFELY